MNICSSIFLVKITYKRMNIPFLAHFFYITFICKCIITNEMQNLLYFLLTKRFLVKTPILYLHLSD